MASSCVGYDLLRTGASLEAREGKQAARRYERGGEPRQVAWQAARLSKKKGKVEQAGPGLYMQVLLVSVPAFSCCIVMDLESYIKTTLGLEGFLWPCSF